MTENNNETTEAVVVRDAPAPPMELTPDDLKRQVNLIQRVMKAVMQEGQHFGVIPGTGSKPSLLKPGAEKLSLTFQLSPTFKVLKTDLDGGHREYEITCVLTHRATGAFVCEGVGSCSTMEGKYRFRKADGPACPECGKRTIIKGKAQFGGGWLCWKTKGGCGTKWPDDDPATEAFATDAGKIEHDNPADYFNTVLKMAKKRAHVDAILTATAASDIFTQDVEDMPEVIDGAGSPPKEKEPEIKMASAAQVKALNGLMKKKKWEPGVFFGILEDAYGVSRFEDLLAAQVNDVLGILEKGPKSQMAGTNQDIPF